MKKPINNETAHELALFAVNEGDLYESQAFAICRNLARKQLRGVYDADKALIAWGHLATAAAKKYNRDLCGFGSVWHDVFSVADRADAASVIADHYQDQIEYELNTLKGN